MNASHSEHDGEIMISPEMKRAGFDVLDEWTGVLDKATLAIEVIPPWFAQKLTPNLFAQFLLKGSENNPQPVEDLEQIYGCIL
jgi:hypothetical protein